VRIWDGSNVLLVAEEGEELLVLGFLVAVVDL